MAHECCVQPTATWKARGGSLAKARRPEMNGAHSAAGTCKEGSFAGLSRPCYHSKVAYPLGSMCSTGRGRWVDRGSRPQGGQMVPARYDAPDDRAASIVAAVRGAKTLDLRHAAVAIGQLDRDDLRAWCKLHVE